MILFFLTFASAAYLLSFIGVNAYNYCAWDHSVPCQAFTKDFTLCGAKPKFSQNCPIDAVMVPFNHTQLLNFINEKRKKVAQGSLHSKPAAKMNRLHWCQELARVAEHSVRLCNNGEFCPHTHHFPDAQIYSMEYEYVETKTIIDMAFMHRWWQSYFGNGKHSDGYAYFMHDQNTHIGCAGSRYTHYTDHKFLFQCVFSHSPKYSEPFTVSDAAECQLEDGLCVVSNTILKKVKDAC